jgi:hypothetical protein
VVLLLDVAGCACGAVCLLLITLLLLLLASSCSVQLLGKQCSHMHCEREGASQLAAAAAAAAAVLVCDGFDALLRRGRMLGFVWAAKGGSSGFFWGGGAKCLRSMKADSQLLWFWILLY